MNKFLILVVLIQIGAGFVSCLQKVRGIPPERASLYDETKSFSCLDGSSVIPFSQVNDDYCDCRDGSDEPGTSACLNGSFACENLGYIVQFIPSSRVNDGICDCCDGSDEYESKVTCVNTCNEMAARMREEEEKMKKLKEEGFVKRKQLVEAANDLKKSLQVQIQELEAKKIEVESERTKLEEKKKAAEELAKEAKDKFDAIVQEKLKELAKVELSKKVNALFELLDLDKDSLIKPEELVKYQELDILFDNDGSFTIEESIRLLDEKDGIDITLFESTYYDKISPHVNVKKEGEEKVDGEGETDHSTEAPPESHEDKHDEEEDIVEATHDHDDEHHHHQPELTNSKYDEKTQALIDESDNARRLFEDSDRNYRDIETQISNARKKLDLDTGANGEFASMIDQCFEYEDREYIYKLCPYEKTVQKSKSNSGETIIGYWKSWGDDGKDKYMSMKFDNGLTCWNGPARSTKVLITCGLENKLTSVSEPNRCEYEMKFETPAVCDDALNSQGSEQMIHEDL